ncbi:hypothetical protein [Streptomyces sp. SID13031]|uniref:hypothetical protein n=1 Tax=Streptomyces sp. SID13031 TaxID=2706046 RepID=UPI0013CDC99A|nr:hypothetical protein [Streptomyces sp. SID13031]NEA32804.1 hypothetical protein [Streptomyces sp. SID13031]
MTGDHAGILRALRGTMSLRAFVDHLVENGLAESSLSTRRLSNLEKGLADLSPVEWDEVADALIRAGVPPEQVEPLRVVPPPMIAPLPTSTPASRLQQWSRIVAPVPDNSWWQRLLAAAARLTTAQTLGGYLQLLDRHGSEREELLQLVRRRLELGATGGPFRPVEGDAVGILSTASSARIQVDHSEPFVLELKLCNRGIVPWRDRLLFRLGAPVTSSLPLTPAILPVPDTDPGDSCDLLVPGRAQFFPNLAVVSYVMVFPDLSSCLPGRLPLWVDTRTEEYDSTFDLPPGFPVARATD